MTRVQTAAELRQQLLGHESAFLHAVAARVQALDAVLDPRSGRMVEHIRLREHTFNQHARTDSQAAHLALLRAGYSATTIEQIISAMPLNTAVAWHVEAPRRKRLRDLEWHDTGILLAAACWSPIDEVAGDTVGASRPAMASDAAQIAERLQLPNDPEAIWLAIASTTGWQGVVPSVLLKNFHCVYFQPAPYGGWALTPQALVNGANTDWFTTAIQPETVDQLEDRIARWFAAEGRILAMAHSGLSVDDVAALVGVPVGTARAFLVGVAFNELGRWIFEDAKSRLVFLGP